jgi:putative flippase GtrA
MRPAILPGVPPLLPNQVSWPKRFVRFCIVGGLAASIDAGGARLLINFLPKLFVLGLSYVCACIFHYIFSKRWTFQDQQGVTTQQVTVYVGANIITLVINTSLSLLFLDLFHQNIVLAKLFALPLTSLVGFLLLRSFVFCRKEPRRAGHATCDKVP